MLVGILSTGFFTKMLASAIALAAVGGVAVSMPDSEPQETASVQVQNAFRLAQAAQDWAACVAEKASEHSGESFDPRRACGEPPQFSDFGLDEDPNRPQLVAADAPGRTGETPGQSGQTPGQSDQTPGQSDQTPGQSDQTPGQSDQTPGQSDQTPGQSDQTPGKSLKAPKENKKHSRTE